MSKPIFRYQFLDHVSMESIEADLTLAILATEGLFGRSRVFLEAGYALDNDRRACVVDAGTQIGRTINTIFVNLLNRFIGAETYRVERIYRNSPSGRVRNPKRKRSDA